ncbi:MAG: glycogen/starch synthase [Bacteriovoracaceae bacterium]|nr:glycogen/starch synthase [Bacteriovoracaceae bacterium]
MKLDTRIDINSEFREKNELPNTPISMTLGEMIKLKNVLGKETFRHVAKVIDVDKRPNILMSAMEFGTLYIKGEPITAKVGGLAVVINDMINNFPKLLNEKRNGNISFAFMAYDGIPECSYVKSFEFWVGNRLEKVEIYKYQHELGATIFFIDHPIFRRRSIRDPQRNLYTPAHGEYYSGREEWEEAFELGLFNRTIAEIQRMIGANIYHAHDYHTGLAAIHMDSSVTVSMTIHNAGPGHQGVYWVKDFGGDRQFNSRFPFGTPGGDWRANDYLLSILGVSFENYMSYFEDGGKFNSLKIIQYIEHHNLISGIPVSDGYAKDLKRSASELSDDIYSQKNSAPSNWENIYIPNDGKDMGLLVGIENGLSDKVHAKNHPFLKKKTEVEIAHIHPLISNLNDRREWLTGLNFGDDLLGPMGIERTHQMKAKLKEMLQRNAELEIAPEKPIFVLISRLVSQKNVAILAENIKHIVHLGGQVVIGGQAGDEEGHSVASQLHHIEHSQQCHGQVRFFNEFINKEMAALIQGGGDFFVITSKFEPCGLTDIEAAWLGTIPLCRKTGGLGKVKNGMYYEWADSSDYWGEVYALRSIIDRAVLKFQKSHDKFLMQRIEAMKEDFSWNMAFSKYFENYRTAACYKLINCLAQNYNLNCDAVLSALSLIFNQFPQDLVASMQMILRQKTNLSHAEFRISTHEFFPAIEREQTSKIIEKSNKKIPITA